MKEPHGKGLANYSDLESCAGIREDGREALDRGMYRLGIEPRKPFKQSVDTVCNDGRQYRQYR